MSNLFVSTGNSKLGLGLTANLSLPPITTCRKNAPCAASCYARRGQMRFEKNQQKYRDNFELWCEAPDLFEEELTEFLTKNHFEYFRWHVSGDIPDQAYYRFMVRMADKFQNIKFLCFTKRYEWVYIEREKKGLTLPWNLSVKLSCWPGLPEPERVYYNIGKVYTTHPDENRAPKSAFHCTGYCPSCRMCWSDIKSMVIPYH